MRGDGSQARVKPAKIQDEIQMLPTTRQPRDLHGADAEPDEDALGQDVLVVLRRDAGHHRAENEHERADDHDRPRAIRVEKPAHEAPLQRIDQHRIPQAIRVKPKRRLTQKKNTQSWSEPIHAIVEAGRLLS